MYMQRGTAVYDVLDGPMTGLRYLAVYGNVTLTDQDRPFLLTPNLETLAVGHTFTQDVLDLSQTPRLRTLKVARGHRVKRFANIPHGVRVIRI